jgi:hypothetical protein
MPATARTATTVTHTALATLLADPGTAADNVNGDTFPNGGSTLLVMNNTAGSSGTVTIATTQSVDGLTAATRTHTIPANSIRVTKLGPPAIYGSTTTVTASASTIKLQAFAI